MVTRTQKTNFDKIDALDAIIYQLKEMRKELEEANDEAERKEVLIMAQHRE